MISTLNDCLSRFLLLSTIFLLLNYTSNSQNELPFSRFGNWITNDPVAMFTDMGPRQFITIGSVGMSVAAVSLTDESTSQTVRRKYSNSWVLNLTNELGDKDIIMLFSAALFGGSLLTRNPKFQDAAFTSLESVLLTHIAISTGKFLFGRSRPIEGDGAYDFDFMQFGGTSFPSGHAATAFALVTPWVVYYPNAFTYSLLAIPATTAIARVANGKHWLSDVMSGAAIGFSMGYYLSKRHLNIPSSQVQIIPSFGSNNIAMVLNIQF